MPIGSTQKMGVGVNVQLRAFALHHIDCPWQPADIEQRDGRVMRQGSQNDEVGNYRYVVEGSFDAYSWQTVEREAGFIAQVMRGRLDVREIDDIGDSALSFAEVKALASGDPLILDKAAVDAERTRLGACSAPTSATSTRCTARSPAPKIASSRPLAICLPSRPRSPRRATPAARPSETTGPRPKPMDPRTA